MRKLLIVLAGILLIVIAVPIAWQIAYPTYIFHYRMTVEVMVEGEIKSGSSVFEVEIKRQPEHFIVPTPPITVRWRGEAVFVELGNDRNLVAALYTGKYSTSRDYPVWVLPATFKHSYLDRDLKQYAFPRGPREVPPDQLPVFVTFSDLSDVRTARIVPPHNFGEAFGRSVQLHRVFIEMVPLGEPVTRQIESKLPFLQSLRGYSGGQFNPDWSHPERNLTKGMFTQ